MALLIAALALAAAAGPAEPTTEDLQAKEHLDRALALYEEKDYVKAAKEFEQAYQADPRPEMLYPWAQSLRLGGNCDAALPLYRRYLESAPAEEGVARAKKQIERCEEVALATAPPRPQPTPPVPVPAPVEAQRHWYTDPLGDVLAVVGIAAGAAAVVLYVFASNTSATAAGASTYGEVADIAGRATAQRTGAWVAGAAGVALCAGAVLTWVLRSSPDSPKVAPTAVSIGPQGLSLRFRF
jgi:tetratricopeptide (TPR) repeat protein